MGVAVGDYDNDGRDDVYITALEGDRLFHNEGGGKFRDVTAAVRHRERQLRHQRRLAGLRPRRQGSTCSSPTTCSGRRDNDLWCSLDGADQVLLHARVVQGHGVEAVPQPRRRQVRGREPEGRDRRSHQQVAGRRRARLQRRRLARPLRGQRHAAQQALPQQAERHLHGRGRGGRRGLRRRRRGARRHGRGCRRLRPLGPPAPAGRQLLEPDARRSTTTKATACSWTRRRRRRWGARAC